MTFESDLVPLLEGRRQTLPSSPDRSGGPLKFPTYEKSCLKKFCQVLLPNTSMTSIFLAGMDPQLSKLSNFPELFFFSSQTFTLLSPLLETKFPKIFSSFHQRKYSTDQSPVNKPLRLQEKHVSSLYPKTVTTNSTNTKQQPLRSIHQVRLLYVANASHTHLIPHFPMNQAKKSHPGVVRDYLAQYSISDCRLLL